MMIRVDGLGRGDDEAFAMAPSGEGGIAVVPGSSFYHRPENGRDKVRFCFGQKVGDLNQVKERMERFFEKITSPAWVRAFMSETRSTRIAPTRQTKEGAL